MRLDGSVATPLIIACSAALSIFAWHWATYERIDQVSTPSTIVRLVASARRKPSSQPIPLHVRASGYEVHDVVLDWLPHGGGKTELKVRSGAPPRYCYTEYDANGQVKWQSSAKGTTSAPPYLEELPYAVAEARSFIHNGKLSVQAAAAAGQIVLPEWWIRAE